MSQAILAGFARHELDRILRINNWRAHNVADGDDYEERVGSLIDVSYREGWLVTLCEALAEARKGRADIYGEFIQVRDTLLAVVDTPQPDGAIQLDRDRQLHGRNVSTATVTRLHL